MITLTILIVCLMIIATVALICGLLYALSPILLIILLLPAIDIGVYMLIKYYKKRKEDNFM